jgi:hypothetical protein
MRVISVHMRLVGIDGSEIDMTEYAPWPERAGMWEADEHIDHDGCRYQYAGCDKDVYVYKEVRRPARRASRA